MFARNKKHRIKKRKKGTSTRISPDPPKNLQGFIFLYIKPEHYIREKKRRLKKKRKKKRRTLCRITIFFNENFSRLSRFKTSVRSKLP